MTTTIWVVKFIYVLPPLFLHNSLKTLPFPNADADIIFTFAQNYFCIIIEFWYVLLQPIEKVYIFIVGPLYIVRFIWAITQQLFTCQCNVHECPLHMNVMNVSPLYLNMCTLVLKYVYLCTQTCTFAPQNLYFNLYPKICTFEWQHVFVSWKKNLFFFCSRWT